MTNKEYFFLEWLIIGKHFTKEQYQALTKEELQQLKVEYLRGNE